MYSSYLLTVLLHTYMKAYGLPQSACTFFQIGHIIICVQPIFSLSKQTRDINPMCWGPGTVYATAARNVFFRLSVPVQMSHVKIIILYAIMHRVRNIIQWRPGIGPPHKADHPGIRTTFFQSQIFPHSHNVLSNSESGPTRDLGHASPFFSPKS